jgi:hypothetical protein
VEGFVVRAGGWDEVKGGGSGAAAALGSEQQLCEGPRLALFVREAETQKPQRSPAADELAHGGGRVGFRERLLSDVAAAAGSGAAAAGRRGGRALTEGEDKAELLSESLRFVLSMLRSFCLKT